MTGLFRCGGTNSANGRPRLEPITPLDSNYPFALRATYTRGNMAFERVLTDLGDLSFNLRRGMNATTMDTLDDLHHITPWLTLQPGVFKSTTVLDIHYDLHFRSQPAFVEVHDIYGSGVRWTRGGAACQP